MKGVDRARPKVLTSDEKRRRKKEVESRQVAIDAVLVFD